MGLFGFGSGEKSGSGSSGLGIGDLTTGISSDGMEQYIADLKASLLEEASNKISNVDGVIQEINAAWQGAARDKFLEDFAKARELVKDDLKEEYKNLKARLTELQALFFETDSTLYGEE